MGSIGDRQEHSRVRRRLIALAGVFLSGCVIGGSLLAPAAGAKVIYPSFTWAGAGSSEGFSLAENWEGGKTAPTAGETLAELRFPELGSGCANDTPVPACYDAEDNLTGLDARSLHIDDAENYELTGTKLEIGSDGLHAATMGTVGAARDVFDLPLELNVSEKTWNITGSGGGAPGEDGLVLEGPVTGPGKVLEVELQAEAALDLEDNIEVGPLTIGGKSGNRSGSGNGILELEEAELNSTDEAPVELGNILVRGSAELGPLKTNATQLDVGRSTQPAGAIEVDSAKFDPASTLTFQITGSEPEPEMDYAQLLSEVGDIDLAGVGVAIEVARPEKGKPCPVLISGEKFTFISTEEGALTGTFAGVPSPGLEVPIRFGQGCEGHEPQGIKLIYGKNTVTGVVEGEVAERKAREQQEAEAKAKAEAELKSKQEEEAKALQEAQDKPGGKTIAEEIAARFGGVGKVGVLSTKEGSPDATIAGTSVTVSSSGAFALKIACPAGVPSCSGTVTLRTLHAVVAVPKHKAAVLSLASGSFTVTGGQFRTITLHLSATARKLLARSHALSARATIAAHDPAGASHTGTASLTLHAAKAKHG